MPDEPAPRRKAGLRADRRQRTDLVAGSARSVDPDATIKACAERQHGVVSRRQLLRSGVPQHAIDHRLKRGRLESLHRGIYRAGPAPARYEREMAAVLACGDRAVLSHRTAAGIWELSGPHPSHALIDVTGPRTLRGPVGGVRLYRTDRFEPDEVDRHLDLPLTTPARTLFDLASRVDIYELERALALAERRGIASKAGLATLLVRHPKRRGAGVLRTLLDLTGDAELTRSEAEARFLDLVRRGKLPRPGVNRKIEGLEVDFLWSREALVVEIDGFAYHAGRGAFERDRHRGAVLIAAGLRVVRFTWRQLTEEPEVVLVQVAQALARSGRRVP